MSRRRPATSQDEPSITERPLKFRKCAWDRYATAIENIFNRNVELGRGGLPLVCGFVDCALSLKVTDHRVTGQNWVKRANGGRRFEHGPQLHEPMAAAPRIEGVERNRNVCRVQGGVHRPVASL